MALDELRVNHAGLDTAAEDLRRTVREIDDRMGRLEQELAPLRSDWTGSAQQAYQVARSRWDRAIREMRDLLDETGRTVQQSNAEYRAADLRGAASSAAERPRAGHARTSGGRGEPGIGRPVRAGAGHRRVRHPAGRPRAPGCCPAGRAGAGPGP